MNEMTDTVASDPLLHLNAPSEQTFRQPAAAGQENTPDSVRLYQSFRLSFAFKVQYMRGLFALKHLKLPSLSAHNSDTKQRAFNLNPT